MNPQQFIAPLLAAAAALPAASQPAVTPDAAARLAAVQVTATRFGDTVQEVPLAMSVVSGDDIRARGATDLRTALALVSGVSVAPGGDAGPAAAVPGLLGLREVDDLLLLIDGVPAGGAFVPTFQAVSLVNVERIEILRGSAPVYFGTTAFAGTINVVHFAAGRAESTLDVRVGSRGTKGASASAVLSTGALRQSVSGEISDERVADPRAGAKRAQATWRAAADTGAGGTLRADVHLLRLRQRPGSPTPADETGRLATQFPVDYNQNPADAKLDTNRSQIVLAHEMPLSFGRFATLLSYTDTRNDSVRGFIDTGDSPPPWAATTLADLEAASQSQRLKDLFFDSHVTLQPAAGLDLTTGVNVLLGRADVHSLRDGLRLLLDGTSSTPATGTVAPKTDVQLDDSRRFVGLYAQGRYALAPGASLLAGLRWNDTHESRDETRRTVRSGAVARTADVQDNRRFSGSLGVQSKVWAAAPAGGGLDAVTLHASVGNTFQPAQIDFNPNPEAKAEGGGLLKAETQRSVVVGMRADACAGRCEIDVEGFVVDFANQPVSATAGGVAVLRPGGRQRYEGVDVEGRLRPAAGWTLAGNAGWSAVRYRDFVTDIDGRPTQLSGRQLTLTPRFRGAAGIVYAGERGWRGSLTASATGKRWLNAQNTVDTPAYAVVDASLGYRFERFTLQLAASNIGNRRDPVLISELGEGQFYRLPARQVTATLSFPLSGLTRAAAP